MARRWWTLVAVGLATFMSYLDNNVINVAIPTIQRNLHLSLASLEWVVSSYVLMFAGLLLVGGQVADVTGRRRMFFIGLTIFTLASLAAGLAGSGGMLIGARVVQGLGAALLAPTTLATIMATFHDPKERTAAIGSMTACAAMALALGPLIGGLISQHLHWGWIFFINVPVGVIALAIAAVSMDDSRDPDAARRFDFPGMIASCVMLLALTYALIEGHDDGWTAPIIVGAFALAAAAAIAFGVIETHAVRPMVAMKFFRSPVFSGGTVTMMLWAFGIFGIYFFTSIYLQDILGFSPTKAGLAFVPMAVCLAAAASVAGPISRRFGTHRIVATGMAMMATGIYLISVLGAGATFDGLMPGFLLFGTGAGLMQVPLANCVLHSQPRERSGIAAALLHASREVAGLLGITVIGAVLRSGQGAALRHGASQAHAYLDGYHTGLLVTVALVTAGAAISFFALRPATQTAAAPAEPDPAALAETRNQQPRRPTRHA